MVDLPRLELIGDSNKRNDYIIYRYQYKVKKSNNKKSKKTNTHKKRNTVKKQKISKGKTRKNFFNIF